MSDCKDEVQAAIDLQKPEERTTNETALYEIAADCRKKLFNLRWIADEVFDRVIVEALKKAVEEAKNEPLR